MASKSSSSEHRPKRPRLSTSSKGVGIGIANANDIPSSPHYQVSYAHRSVVTCTSYSSKHDMILTASQDGIVKFWKRMGTLSANNSSANKSSSSSGGIGGSGSGAGSGAESSGQCVEFVKSYVAHTAPPACLVMSEPDGDIAASVGEDNVIKFYDVGGFDVTGMIRVSKDYKCGGAAAFVGEDQNLLAVSSSSPSSSRSSEKAKVGAIYIFSSVTLSATPVKVINIHAAPIIAMSYNVKQHCMISADQKGVIEYWNGSMHGQQRYISSSNQGGSTTTDSTIQDYDNIDDVGNDDIANAEQKRMDDAAYATLGEAPLPERNGIKFSSKFDTDLYSILKKKAHVISLAMSPTGSHFAVYGSDRKVRLFDYKTGKTVVQYDERMKVYDAQVQKRQERGDTSSSSNGMDAIDFGNRAAREKEMADTSILDLSVDKSYQECGNQSLWLQFDPTGHYLIVPTIIGIKVIEWSTNKCKKVIGKGDASTFRFLGGCMCLGDAKVDKQMLLARNTGMSAATNSSDKDGPKLSDALFITMSFNKRRFFVFSHKDPMTIGDSADQQEAAMNRDILNEAPDAEDLLLNNMEGPEGEENKLGKEAILRTTMGDIHIRLFPNETPKTVENFCGHARNNYYDNVIFHRVIKSFMLQTGDPLGDGTGGESIWGGEFEDEFIRDLRHDRPFTVSMANAGPGTNGSQFFITTVPTPWLDNKHTVFGRVTRGMDVCSAIENTKVDELDKPLDEISIVSIDIL
mmetsp:Transcript_30156/g.46143  ORF Transcript_30156/g.46143 Transcript_30156/m.46143 type:complete len:743 (-) Transcript_30156:109-2337(-)